MSSSTIATASHHRLGFFANHAHSSSRQPVFKVWKETGSFYRAFALGIAEVLYLHPLTILHPGLGAFLKLHLKHYPVDLPDGTDFHQLKHLIQNTTNLEITLNELAMTAFRLTEIGLSQHLSLYPECALSCLQESAPAILCDTMPFTIMLSKVAPGKPWPATHTFTPRDSIPLSPTLHLQHCEGAGYSVKVSEFQTLELAPEQQSYHDPVHAAQLETLHAAGELSTEFLTHYHRLTAMVLSGEVSEALLNKFYAESFPQPSSRGIQTFFTKSQPIAMDQTNLTVHTLASLLALRKIDSVAFYAKIEALRSAPRMRA